MPDFLAIVRSIQALKPGKWLMHQSVLENELGLQGYELDNFLQRVEHGGTGLKKRGTFVSNTKPFDTPIDLKDTRLDNPLNLHSYPYAGNSRNRGVLSSNDGYLPEPSPQAVNEPTNFCRSGRVRSISSLPTLSLQLEIAAPTKL